MTRAGQRRLWAGVGALGLQCSSTHPHRLPQPSTAPGTQLLQCCPAPALQRGGGVHCPRASACINAFIPPSEEVGAATSEAHGSSDVCLR